MFNEAPNVESLSAAFESLLSEWGQRFEVQFIIVDDGSSDGTADEIARATQGLPTHVLTHTHNAGPGRAFGTAFAHLDALVRSEDLIVTLEGDTTSRLEVLAQMIRRVDEGYDAVLASPYMYGGGVANTQPLRVFLSYAANTFAKEFLGIRGILTISSFYRLYRGSLVQELQRYYGPLILERHGFECMVELLMKMIYLRSTIAEVPMSLDGGERAGQSKMRVGRVVLGYFGLFQRKRAWQEASSMPRPTLPPPV